MDSLGKAKVAAASTAVRESERAAMTPSLHRVASPSPIKVKKREAQKPRLDVTAASVGALRLPTELFQLATSRTLAASHGQADLVLSKALDGIQAAATRLEAERTRLVIQSQELQIWDMAREEELGLLKAENEQLEQQLLVVSEKISKGLGRDGVLESLQFALRKARGERDAEVREADTLFNQLQDAKAAEQALLGLEDEWSAVPLLAEEMRRMRARAASGMLDPTQLNQADLNTLLRGLAAIGKQGVQLQAELQALRGEKAALTTALDAAHGQLQELQAQNEQLQQRPVASTVGSPARSALPVVAGPQGSGASATPAEAPTEALAEAAGLRAQVQELSAKLAEYRSYLEDNQQEIEALQAVHGTPTRHHPSSSSPISTVNYASPPPHVAFGGGSASVGAISPSQLHQQQVAADIAVKVAELQELAVRVQRQAAEREAELAAAHESELAALRSALEAAQEAAQQELEAIQEREAALAAAHSQALSELYAQLATLAQQHVAALAEREAALATQHAQALAGVEARLGDLHVEAVGAQAAAAAQALHEQAARLEAQHAQQLRELEERLVAVAKRQAEELEQRVNQQHAEAATQRDAEVRRRHAERLAEQAAQLARLHADQAAALGMQHAEALADREAELTRLHSEALALREATLLAEAEKQWREREAELREAFAAEVVEREARLAAAQEEQARATVEELGRLQAAVAEAAAREAALASQLREAVREAQAQAEQALRVQLEEVAAAAEAEAAAQAAAAHNAMLAAEAEKHQSELAAQRSQLLADAESWQAAATEQLENANTALQMRIAELESELSLLQQQLEERPKEAESAAAAQQAQELQAAVGSVERQYVEMVARLGREHEKLREANLDKVVERHAREAAEARREAAEVKRMAAERVGEMQDQMADLQSLLDRERRADAAAAASATEQLDLMEGELRALRGREEALQREVVPLREEVRRCRWLVRDTQTDLSDMEQELARYKAAASPPVSPGSAAAPGPAHSPQERPGSGGGAEDSPEKDEEDKVSPVDGKRSSKRRSAAAPRRALLSEGGPAVGGKPASAGGASSFWPWATPQAFSRPAAVTAQAGTDAAGASATVASASGPPRPMRRMTADDIPSGWDGSAYATASLVDWRSADLVQRPPTISTADAGTSGPSHPPGSELALTAPVEAGGAGQHNTQQLGVLSDEEWGDLRGASPQRSPVPHPADATPAASPSREAKQAGGSGSVSPVASVSTTSSYNSNTELCFVDEDEEDAEAQQRVLAAALAESRRVSMAEGQLPEAPPLPPALVEIQQRRMSVSGSTGEAAAAGSFDFVAGSRRNGLPAQAAEASRSAVSSGGSAPGPSPLGLVDTAPMLGECEEQQLAGQEEYDQTGRRAATSSHFPAERGQDAGPCSGLSSPNYSRGGAADNSAPQSSAGSVQPHAQDGTEEVWRIWGGGVSAGGGDYDTGEGLGCGLTGEPTGSSLTSTSYPSPNSRNHHHHTQQLQRSPATAGVAGGSHALQAATATSTPALAASTSPQLQQHGGSPPPRMRSSDGIGSFRLSPGVSPHSQQQQQQPWYRSSVTAVPLMTPNPLFEDRGSARSGVFAGSEPSPPWSAADWSAAGGSAQHPAADDGQPGIDTGAPSRYSGAPAAIPGSPGLLVRQRSGKRSMQGRESGGLSPTTTAAAEMQRRDRRSSDRLARGGHVPSSWAASDAAAPQGSSGPPVAADEAAETRSLLAAGASLGSSELRKRQRRRMGDFPSPLALSFALDSPLDAGLLTGNATPAAGVARQPAVSPAPISGPAQSWEFSCGVATPLSPGHRSRVQGHVVGHSAPRGYHQHCAASPNAAHSPSQPARAAAQPGFARLSADSAATTGTRGAGASTPGAQLPPPVPLPASAAEARARGREVLGRVMGRVASLQGLCAHLSPAASGAATPMVASMPGSANATPRRSASSLSGTPAPVLQGSVISSISAGAPPADTAAAAGGAPAASITTVTPEIIRQLLARHPQQQHTLHQHQPALPQSPLLAPDDPDLVAGVVGALEELRTDLFELEKLHQLARLPQPGATGAGRQPSAAGAPISAEAAVVAGRAGHGTAAAPSEPGASAARQQPAASSLLPPGSPMLAPPAVFGASTPAAPEGITAPAAAATATPGGNADPVLMAALAQTVQSQLAGQLGALQAKIADLQRQNQTCMQRGGDGGCSPASGASTAYATPMLRAATGPAASTGAASAAPGASPIQQLLDLLTPTSAAPAAAASTAAPAAETAGGMSAAQPPTRTPLHPFSLVAVASAAASGVERGAAAAAAATAAPFGGTSAGATPMAAPAWGGILAPPVPHSFTSEPRTPLMSSLRSPANAQPAAYGGAASATPMPSAQQAAAGHAPGVSTPPPLSGSVQVGHSGAVLWANAPPVTPAAAGVVPWASFATPVQHGVPSTGGSRSSGPPSTGTYSSTSPQQQHTSMSLYPFAFGHGGPGSGAGGSAGAHGGSEPAWSGSGGGTHGAGMLPGHRAMPHQPYSPEELSHLPPGVQLFAPPQLRAAAVAVATNSRQHPWQQAQPQSLPGLGREV
eukprot:XP_001699703.1 predicted protein [Chlamydomonas reinhardtii]